MNFNENYEGTRECFSYLTKMFDELKKDYIQHCNDKHNFELIDEYFLSELKGNFESLKLILKKVVEENGKMNGYFEVARGAFETSFLTLFVLNNKDLILNRLTMFEYIQQFTIKNRAEFLLDGAIQELKSQKNFYPYREVENSILEYNDFIDREIEKIKNSSATRVKQAENEINKIIADPEIKAEIDSKPKISYPKFYNYFSNYYCEKDKKDKSVKSFKDLCKLLKKETFYDTTYNITSAIAHGEMPQLKHDPSLVYSTTHENNILVCEIIKRLCLCFFDEHTQDIFEEKIETILGANYSKVENIAV